MAKNKNDFYLVIDPAEDASEEDKHLAPGFEFHVFWGEDGTPVVEVRTEKLPENEKGPVCRVYLNDGVLFENPPFKRETPAWCTCEVSQ